MLSATLSATLVAVLLSARLPYVELTPRRLAGEWDMMWGTFSYPVKFSPDGTYRYLASNDVHRWHVEPGNVLILTERTLSYRVELKTDDYFAGQLTGWYVSRSNEKEVVNLVTPVHLRKRKKP